MSRVGRLAAETRAAWYAFVRRRTAVFFTFLFPVILVVIFGALVQTDPTGGGLFAEPPAYYVAGYLAVVVLFTPLSRVGSEVARHREGNRFERLATTPLTRTEWLFAQTLVNVIVVGLAAALVLALVVLLTGASIRLSVLLVPFVALGVALFCGFGAVLGRLADSQDGVVAAANAVGLPLLFLSDTFVPPALLPSWFVPLMDLSPLTYVARGVRASTAPTGGAAGAGGPGGTGVVGGDPLALLAVLAVLTVGFFAAGAVAIPQTE